MRLHYFFGEGLSGMENKDVTLFTGTGLKKEEIKKVMLAGDREAHRQNDRQ